LVADEFERRRLKAEAARLAEVERLRQQELERLRQEAEEQARLRDEALVSLPFFSPCFRNPYIFVIHVSHCNDTKERTLRFLQGRPRHAYPSHTVSCIRF
jgi:hypothetical protein